MDIIYVFSPAQVSILSSLWNVGFFFLNQKKNKDTEPQDIYNSPLCQWI